MFLKPNQMYLESQGLYQKVCRLAQVRVQLKALQVEADNLEQQIYDAMCPATELVDVLYLRTQKGLSDAELSKLFVARKEQDCSLTVHPAYVSERFRPGGTLPDIQPGESLLPMQQMELFPELVDEEIMTENEEEREGVLPPAPLSPEEKEEEREVVVKKEKDDAEKRKMPNPEEDINIPAFIRFFNGIMANAAIPKIATLQGERLKSLRARCREHGKNRVAQVLQRAASMSFLNGGGNQGWVASLDWLLRPNNFSKVMEGVYCDFKPKHRTMSPEQRAANKAIEQQISDEYWKSVEQRERNCVTYEEYLRLKEGGECSN
jgi:hypothetical protein